MTKARARHVVRLLTTQEQASLEVGHIVCYWHATIKGWIKGKVIQCHHNWGVVPCISFRRLGTDKIGRRYKSILVQCTHLALPIDPEPANVYADWLEDHNEPEAAAKLRQAFPLSQDSEK